MSAADDFFTNFESGNGSNPTGKGGAAVPTAKLGGVTRRKAPPPPPPRQGRPAATTTTRTARPVINSNTTNAAPPAGAVGGSSGVGGSYYSNNARPAVQSRRPAGPSTTTSGGASYYGNTTINNNTAPYSAPGPTAPAAKNPYASSRVAAPTPNQFYQQPQQPQQQQMTPAEDDTDDWFQDDQQQQQQDHHSVGNAPSVFGGNKNNHGTFSGQGQFQQQTPGQFPQQQPMMMQQEPVGQFQQRGQFPQQAGQFPQPGNFGGIHNNNNNNNDPLADPNDGLSGAMDGGVGNMMSQQQPNQQPQAQAKPNIFMPSMMSMMTGGGSGGGGGGTALGAPAKAYEDEDIENEPPLLEELGIHPEHIVMKVKAVILPSQRIWGSKSALIDASVIVDDADLAGPAAFGLLLGGELLLTGKVHFGYIYGFGLFGCLAMTLLINLLSPQQPVSLWTVMSILGYCLLPVNILAAVKIFVVNLAHLSSLGQVFAVIAVVWSTAASTRLLEVGCKLRDQRWLLAYPLALVYSAFVLITIF